jgi:integrase
MSWVDKDQNSWRLREKRDGKNITIVKNLGIYKELALITLGRYKKALAMGFTFRPPIAVADIENFISAKERGLDAPAIDRRLTIDEMLNIYEKQHGPSVKGGINPQYGSTYYNFQKRLILFRRFWPNKYVDEIHKYEIRDFLAQYPNVGTQMRYLGTLGHMFRSFYDWNEDNVLGFQVRLPKQNPAARWRKEMKPAQKRDLPDARVLTPEEWERFRQHLKPRTLAICEMALYRVLRKADIKKFAPQQVVNGYIQGLQQKTGGAFSIPVLSGQPQKYDFKNFKREFLAAQKAAGMDWPASHKLHFSFKDLRRTGAMWAYRRTKDLAGVSAMLGHEGYKTTKKYLNITQADTLSITKELDKIAGGPTFGSVPTPIENKKKDRAANQHD